MTKKKQPTEMIKIKQSIIVDKWQAVLLYKKRIKKLKYSENKSRNTSFRKQILTTRISLDYGGEYPDCNI